jgi:hypothetical protein
MYEAKRMPNQDIGSDSPVRMALESEKSINIQKGIFARRIRKQSQIDYQPLRET